MSHYTVAVIYDPNETSYEELLAPYNEDITVEPYITDCWCLNDDEAKEDCSTCDGLGKRATNYNPDSKWDWYQLGGRWEGYCLLTKDGKTPDIAKLEDIDFEGLVKRTTDKITEQHTALFKDFTKERLIQLLDKEDEATEDERKKLTDHFGIFFDIEVAKQTVNGTLEEWIDRETKPAIQTFGTLTKDGWLEPGAMGWWGISIDTPESKDEYRLKLDELYKSTPQHYEIAIVDCHI